MALERGLDPLRLAVDEERRACADGIRDAQAAGARRSATAC